MTTELIEPTWLPCLRCGLLPPDPNPRWLGARAGTCPCWPDQETTEALTERVRDRHARAVCRAMVGPDVSEEAA